MRDVFDGNPGGVCVRAAAAHEADEFLSVLCAAFALNKDAARPRFYQDPFYDLSLKRLCIVDPRGPHSGAESSGAIGTRTSEVSGPLMSKRTRTAALPHSGAESIVSCLTIVPAQLRVGGAVVAMGGIAGVATLPACRSRGYAGTLLSRTLVAMADDLGLSLSALFPVRPEYYARFGWTWATRTLTWSCDRASVLERTSVPDTGRLGASTRRVRPAELADTRDLDGITLVHAAGTARRTGAVVRGPERWHVIHRMLHGRETFVCCEPTITGYAHCERLDGLDVLRVHEMHASTDTAVGALLGFLAAAGPYRRIEWLATSADLRRFGLDAGNFAGQAIPDGMLRITNLPAALASAHPANYAPILADGSSLTIITVDPIVARNRLPFTIARDGVRKAEREPDGEPSHGHSIAAGIDVITQLYMGYTTPTAAAAESRLTASSTDALALADRLFPLRDPHIPSLDRF
jgi:predicted acetyltransferase